MHWRTFERLLCRYHGYEQASFAAMLQRFGKG
jgi:hypothetical protein